MGKTGGMRALVLPGDLPPRRSSLKRLLLFFDHVTLIHPDDRAFLNNREIVEEFPGSISRIEWSEQSRFPRSDDYDEDFRALIAETGPLQQRDLLSFRPWRPSSLPHPRTRMLALAAALPNPALVNAAVPDFDLHRQPKVPDGILFLFSISPGGFRSQFAVEVPDPYNLPDSGLWSSLAWLRLGRSLKFLELSRWMGSVPVALDEVNQSICVALGTDAVPNGVRPESIMTEALSAEAVDTRALDEALMGLPWSDVLRLRHEVLPRVAEFRELLTKKANRLVGIAKTDPSRYRDFVAKFREDFEAAHSEHRRKLRELVIGTALKAGGAAGIMGTLHEMDILVSPISFHSTLVMLLAGIGATGATLSTEIRAAVSAYARVKEHPLYFFERLPKVARGPVL